jgi:multisubunit Na+/H+ antiporter MnhF subunit
VILPPPHGLVALEIAGVLVCTILMLLSEGFHRQPFIDLAVVLAPMALVGALVFARVMEREL